MDLLNFVLDNIATILVLIVVVLLLSAVVLAMIRSRKKGCNCSGCDGCPLSGKCHSACSNSDLGKDAQSTNES